MMVEATLEYWKQRAKDAGGRMSTIYPDCMMPDGAEPCEGFKQVEQELADAKAERDRYKAALAGLLDAVDKYTYGSLGEAEDEAREVLQEQAND